MSGEWAVIKRKRPHRNTEGGVDWQSTGTAKGLWTLTAGGDNKARLVLTLDVAIEDEIYELEFLWASGNFSAVKGGVFGPVGDNTITQTLNARGVKSQKYPPVKAKPRVKAKRKAGRKAKRTKKRRVRR